MSLALVPLVPGNQGTNELSPQFVESEEGVLCGGLGVAATATVSTSSYGYSVTFVVSSTCHNATSSSIQT